MTFYSPVPSEAFSAWPDLRIGHIGVYTFFFFKHQPSLRDGGINCFYNMFQGQRVISATIRAAFRKNRKYCLQNSKSNDVKDFFLNICLFCVCLFNTSTS